MADSTASPPPAAGPYALLMLALNVYVLLVLAAWTVLPLSPDTARILEYADAAVCAVFLADFARGLVRAKSKPAYLRWGWIDLVSSIPTIGVLRLGRAVRVVRVLRLLRGFRSVRHLTAHLLRRRAQAASSAAALISFLLIIFSAIAILHFERGAEGANIQSPADALWWAAVTITTVGYGDRFPVTPEGRAMATALMVAGVGLFGTFTGLVATWFLTPAERREMHDLEEIRTRLDALVMEIRELRRPSRPEGAPDEAAEAMIGSAM
ncbi:MAG TPA: ion transporter [Longimicrobium sp.]|nr:ion transporter [Longimicrobium sp.]